MSASFGTLSIISHSTVVGIAIGLPGASLTVVFYLKTRIVKKLLNVTRQKKKKHNKIIMLAKSKLNSIETLMLQAIIDLDISHKTIVNENEKYEQMTENIRNTKNSRDFRENNENTEILKKFFFFFFMYKMLVITIENCKNAKVHTIELKNKDFFWIKMIDIQNELGLKNMS